MLTVNCRTNNKIPWSPHSFYVSETHGPIILCQHSCQLLGLVTLHCAMIVKQPVPITNIEQLMKSDPTSFDTLGQFKGDYHIVLKPDSQPVVHAPFRCVTRSNKLYMIWRIMVLSGKSPSTPWYLLSHTHARVMVN